MALIVPGLVFIIYLATLGVLEPRGFWITDDANKFLQVTAILNSSCSDFSLPWPGGIIDHDFEYNPIPVPFSRVVHGRLFSVFSPVFALISAFLFRCFGYWGLYILPVLASLLMLIGVARITRTIASDALASHGAVILAGLCTPVWFYSVVFWEHTPAACLCIWALYCCLRFFNSGSAVDLMLASMLGAFSIYFRDELYIFCAVLAISVILIVPGKRQKNASLSLATMALCLMPLWAFQWFTINAPFGHHLSTHLFSTAGFLQHLLARPSVFYHLLIAAHPQRLISLAMAAPFLALLCINPRVSLKAFGAAVPIYSLMAAAAATLYLAGLFGAASPIQYLLQTSNSFFVTAPIAIVAFVQPKKNRDDSIDPRLVQWLWLVALAYAVLYCLIAPELGSVGIHWGNRYLLVLYPVFAILAAINLAQWLRARCSLPAWRTATVLLVVLISFIAQIASLQILHKKKALSYRMNQEVATIAEPVLITDLWWAASELHAAFYGRMFFYVSTRQQLHDLQQKLYARGYSQFIFVTQPRADKSSRALKRIDDDELHFFDLAFYARSISIGRPE